MIHVDPEHVIEISERARFIMEQENIDALVASTCENFYYVSGHPSTFMTTLRMADIALAVVFRDANRKTILILNDFEATGVAKDLPQCEIRTYPTWVDIDDPYGLMGDSYQGSRPVAPQAEAMFGVLKQLLAEHGIAEGRVAFELGALRNSSVKALEHALQSVELVEANRIFVALRAIKTRWEIEQLRKACAYAEAGITEAISRVQVGSSADGIVRDFRQSLMSFADGSTARFHMISVGANFAPAHRFDTTPGQPGDLIKLDVGVDVAGYGSDIARTFVLGKPSDVIQRIYHALRTGHDHLLALIEPGKVMSDVFDEVMQLIRDSGLPNYNRGHLGHSVGLGLAAEEAPYIGPSEQTVFQPGMVICLETPYYGHGVGAIMIEDMVLVTETGCERLNTLSRDLISL